MRPKSLIEIREAENEKGGMESAAPEKFRTLT
jgi:hypothetical protein